MSKRRVLKKIAEKGSCRKDLCEEETPYAGCTFAPRWDGFSHITLSKPPIVTKV